jgi:hypothetical protein
MNSNAREIFLKTINIFWIVFWDVLPPSSGMMEAARTSADNYFTRQYIPEDNSELHTRRRENLKSQYFCKNSVYSSSHKHMRHYTQNLRE